MSAFIRLFKSKWIYPPKQVEEDYTGRTIIVTGATSGIGREAVYKFAALGASKVIIAARDLHKGDRIKSILEARLVRKNQLEIWKLDMMEYDSVMAFAERANELDRLDIVILNAGARRNRYVQSQHGWEEDIQINMLSTTLLAILLLPKLKATNQQFTQTPVLEIVNSGVHQNAVVPREALNEPNILNHYNDRDQFKEGIQYKFSKVFLMYVTQELAKAVSSKDVIITSICPGLVLTELGRDHFFPGVFLLAFFFTFIFMRSPAQGANMILSGTTQGEKVHGRFWQHDKVQPIPISLRGPDMQHLGSRIWNETLEALTKEVPEISTHLHEVLA